MLLRYLSRHIQEQRQFDWSGLAIDNLCLDSLFLSVRLRGGTNGAAKNYDQEGVPDITPAQIDQTLRDPVKICHRFSRQNHQGMQKISSGRFIDIRHPASKFVIS